jgi:hypothetical protein
MPNLQFAEDHKLPVLAQLRYDFSTSSSGKLRTTASCQPDFSQLTWSSCELFDIIVLPACVDTNRVEAINLLVMVRPCFPHVRHATTHK